MFQILMSLDDDQIELVLGAVRIWCMKRGVEIESDDGRRAVTIAVDCILSTGTLNFATVVQARLDDVSVLPRQ